MNKTLYMFRMCSIKSTHNIMIIFFCDFLSDYPMEKKIATGWNNIGSKVCYHIKHKLCSSVKTMGKDVNQICNAFTCVSVIVCMYACSIFFFFVASRKQQIILFSISSLDNEIICNCFNRFFFLFFFYISMFYRLFAK